MELNPEKDEAVRFLYLTHVPWLCADCKPLRCIEYEDDTDYTVMKTKICPNCRFYGLKMMNYDYVFFKKPKEPEPEPEPEAPEPENV